MNHDCVSIDTEGELVVMTCKCSVTVRGNDEEHARERFALHHAKVAASQGVRAARAALKGETE